MNNFETIAIRKAGLAVCGFRNDFEVPFNRQLARLKAECDDQLADGHWPVKAHVLAVDFQFHKQSPFALE